MPVQKAKTEEAGPKLVTETPDDKRKKITHLLALKYNAEVSCEKIKGELKTVNNEIKEIDGQIKLLVKDVESEQMTMVVAAEDPTEINDEDIVTPEGEEA